MFYRQCVYVSLRHGFWEWVSECVGFRIIEHLGMGQCLCIFVKTINGKTITLHVAAAKTVDDIKCQVQQREGIPVDQQRLIFGGKVLQGRSTLADAGIEKECTLQLALAPERSYRLQAYGDRYSVFPDHIPLYYLMLLHPLLT